MQSLQLQKCSFFISFSFVKPICLLNVFFFFSSDPSFAYVGRSDDVTDIHCDFRGRGLGVRCLLGNPYASNRTDSLLFRVAPSQSSPFVQNSASFSVVTNTSSEDIGATSDRTHEIEVCNLLRIVNVQYSLEILGFSAT